MSRDLEVSFCTNQIEIWVQIFHWWTHRNCDAFYITKGISI